MQHYLLNEPISDPAVIELILPQRPPILMIDTVLRVEENKVVTSLTIREDDLFIDRGRFSESGMLENIAQTVAARPGYYYYKLQEPAPVGYIGDIKKFNVYRQPNVGQTITTEVEVVGEAFGVTLVTGKILLEGEVIADCRMKTVIAEQNDEG